MTIWQQCGLSWCDYVVNTFSGLSFMISLFEIRILVVQVDSVWKYLWSEAFDPHPIRRENCVLYIFYLSGLIYMVDRNRIFWMSNIEILIWWRIHERNFLVVGKLSVSKLFRAGLMEHALSHVTTVIVFLSTDTFRSLFVFDESFHQKWRSLKLRTSRRW